jgi:hypothetical protein
MFLLFAKLKIKSLSGVLFNDNQYLKYRRKRKKLKEVRVEIGGTIQQ